MENWENPELQSLEDERGIIGGIFDIIANQPGMPGGLENENDDLAKDDKFPMLPSHS